MYNIRVFRSLTNLLGILLGLCMIMFQTIQKRNLRIQPSWRNWTAHRTSNPAVVGSSPTEGALILKGSGEYLKDRAL